MLRFYFSLAFSQQISIYLYQSHPSDPHPHMPNPLSCACTASKHIVALIRRRLNTLGCVSPGTSVPRVYKDRSKARNSPILYTLKSAEVLLGGIKASQHHWQCSYWEPLRMLGGFVLMQGGMKMAPYIPLLPAPPLPGATYVAAHSINIKRSHCNRRGFP